ncbi:hypothetical protein [Nocardioides caldifontis]|uniref:hypothetical protein n=1 Tax=Nocardioides caldifontis TaxID=2588938 RepID=UPI0011DFAB68|nr:hypothetical protein [Nocardioides caldifontis]
MIHRSLSLPLVVAVTALALAAGPATAAVTSTPGPSSGVAGSSTALAVSSSPLSKAQATLTKAAARLRAGRRAKAVRALTVLSRQVVEAQRAAVRQIGKPPADPESDEPPGPGAVLAVLGLDHRVTSALVPQLASQKGPRVVGRLGRALQRTHVSRNRMIGKVVGLPPAKGDDYADGMSDVLGQFPAELRQISTALASKTLTKRSRAALVKARARVARANRLMLGEYGGGE